MKKVIIFILVLILSSCTTPQVTATSEVTITLTPTIIPTQTPQPPSPAFLDLQEEIAQSDIYTLTPTGLEMENADGTITLIPDILPNPQDGTFTITYEDNEYLVEFVSLDGQILTFKDEDGNTFVFNGENLVQALTQEQLDQMTDEEKLAKAPEKMADLTKSNISTVKNNLVIYRDSETNARMVFDLLTGKELTLPEAGIIEFEQTDGGKIELLSFETYEELYNYVSNETVWLTGGINERMKATSTFFKGYTPEDKALFNELDKIPEFQNGNASGYTLPNSSEDKDFFAGFKYETTIGTFWCFKDENGNLKVVYQSN